MSRLFYRALLITAFYIFVLLSTTDSVRRNDLSIHVTIREVNCSLPCQQFVNGTCVDDCPERSYCDGYFNACVECAKHCILCMSSNFCEDCDDDLMPVIGRGCVKSCEPGHYHSPYAMQCLACSPNCLNCSGLNQCHNCSEGYTLYNDNARQVCILPCNNGSFYNQSSDRCQTCAEHCQHCIPSLGCVKCEDEYVITNNHCFLATPTATMQSTATPTTTMQSTATPTTTMQSTATLTTTVQSTATPTTTVQPVNSREHNETIYYIVGGVGGGVVVIVTLTIIVIITLICYQRRRRKRMNFKPLLQFTDDSDEES